MSRNAERTGVDPGLVRTEGLAGSFGDSAASFMIGGAGPKAAGLSLTMSGPDAFRICLRGADGGPLMVLGPYDQTEVVSAWRSISEVSGLPFMVMDAAPGEMADEAGEGPEALVVRDRRKRLIALSGRKPRFLGRRKAARLPRRPLVHRETEIIGGGRD